MVQSSEQVEVQLKSPQDWTIEEIRRELDEEYDGRLREEALRAAQHHASEITPHLIEFLRQATVSMRQGQRPRGEGYFYAFFLLAEFRAQEALPALVEAVSLPGEAPYELFDDSITEYLNRVLAVLAVDSPQVLDDLAADRQVNEFVRWAAAGTWLFLVRDGRMTHDEAVGRLRRLLRDSIANKDDFAGMIVCELLSFVAEEAKDDIAEAFRQDLVDLTMIREEDVARAFSSGRRTRESELERCPESGIADTVEELKPWAAFQQQAPEDPELEFNEDDPWYPIDQAEPISDLSVKVGRNSPCPCGSGKKYKKCCWR